MPEQSSNTELGFKVLAWLAIIFGAFGVFGGIFGSLMMLFMPLEKMYAGMPQVDPAFAVTMARMMRIQAVFALVLVPCYGGGIAAGVGILQRRPWSRLLMERVCWAGLAASLAMTVYFATQVDFSSFFASLPVGQGAKAAQAAELMGAMGKVMNGAAVAMGLARCAVIGFLLWFLRRQVSRDLFEQA